jgi:hypothetical protein
VNINGGQGDYTPARAREINVLNVMDQVWSEKIGIKGIDISLQARKRRRALRAELSHDEH